MIGRSRGIGAWQSDAALYLKLMKGRLERERNRLLNCLREVRAISVSCSPHAYHSPGERRWGEVAFPHASNFFEPAQTELMELNMDAEYACPLPLFVRNSDLLVPPFRCTTLRQQIAALTEGEYANAKREVDAIHGELG